MPPNPRQLGAAMIEQFRPLLQAPQQSQLTVLSEAPLFQRIQREVQELDPGARVYIFGSTRVYGFHDSGAYQQPSAQVPPSDVDMAVLRREDLLDGSGVDPSSELTRNVQAEFLEKLLNRLQQSEGSASIRSNCSSLVKRTRVPVLRVKHLVSNHSPPHDKEDNISVQVPFDFDITCGRRCGIRNSALFFHYVQQMPMIRFLLLSVKKWSKQTGLNSAIKAPYSNNNNNQNHNLTSVMGGSLTSYGFHVLLLYYLLRRGVVQYIPMTVSSAAGSTDRIPNPQLDVNAIPPVPTFLPLLDPALEPHGPQGDPVRYLGELALDWCHFYLHEFDVEKEVVSLSRFDNYFADSPPSGPFPVITKDVLGWTKRREDQGRLRGEKVHYTLCIEDPYEVNLNVGRNVTSLKWMLFRKHLEKAIQTGLLLCPPSK